MMRARIAAVLLVGGLAAGCGGGSDDAGGDAGGDTDSNASAAGDTAPDATETEAPAFCDLLDPADVAAAVGAAVTLETGPSGDCEIGQDDPRALSGSVGTVQVDIGNGGYEAYRSGSSASLDGAVEHPLDGIGDEAYVTTGTFAGSENLQAAGGALVGGNVHTVTLVQGVGLSEEELVEISEQLLTLLVEVA